jgi:signal transduction histidine kinase
MRRGSIAATLFWFSAGWLVIALVATAFLLSSLYSNALDRDLTDQLENNLDLLVGAVVENGAVFDTSLVIELAEARFNQPGSGWYWEIRRNNTEMLRFSGSLLGSVLPELTSEIPLNDLRVDTLTDDFGNSLRAIERRIVLFNETYAFTVAGNLSEVDGRVDEFRSQTLLVLLVVGGMLAIGSAVIARMALRPVGRLRASIEEIREGEADRVGGQYPVEIAPLADEVNELLRSNAEIIDRARNQVGNLAHGLKTPLAVLRNEAENSYSELAVVVGEQTDKMNEIVSTYLDRSRLAARTAVVGRRADAGALIERLSRVMSRLHPEIDIDVAAQEGAPWFRGEEADFEEMAGNLIENACKWAKGAVRIAVASGGEAGLMVTVEDDGPGLTDEEAARVLQRGVRLDEKTPGSGIGLDIVQELAGVYGGRLELGRSDLGGLRAILHLPAARTSKR